MKGGNCTAQKVTASGQEVKRKLNARAFCFLKNVYQYHHWSICCFASFFLLCTRALLFLRSYTLLPTPRPFPSSSHQTKAIITPHLFFSISFSFLLLFLYTRTLSFYIFARTCAPAPFSFYTLKPLPHSLSSPSGHDDEEEGECPSSLLFLHTPEH